MDKTLIVAPFLVENNAFMEAVKSVGASQGYEVVFTRSVLDYPGPDDEAPDLLLLEPSVFHWEWLQMLLRFSTAHRHTPIVLFSTQATAEEGMQRISVENPIWLVNELPMLKRLLREIKGTIGRPAKTILFVDDDAQMLNAYGRMLRKTPWKVIKSTSGEQALKTIESTRVDLIVTDIKMREMNGMELVAKIRSRDKAIPIVVSSGFPGLKDDLDLKYHGIEAFLAKPIEESRLCRDLARILDARSEDGSAGPRTPGRAKGDRPATHRAVPAGQTEAK
jgi:CheY-like chemotaxis protein